MNKEQLKERLSEIEKERDDIIKKLNTPDKSKEQEMEEVFREIITGLTVMPYDEECPNSLFLFKGDKLFFEIENSDVWCSWDNVWSKISRPFSL